jgi:hypothetical protein
MLGPFCKPLSDFKEQLFGLSTIQSLITRGKLNVITCEFEYDEAQALSNSVAVPPLPQLSQLSQMLHLSQMPQYAANPLDMGGYPFGMVYGMPSIHPYDNKEAVPFGFGFGIIGPDM